MAIAFRHTSRISVDVWTGTIDPQETARHIDAIAGEPEWGVPGAILTDLTGIAADSRPSPATLEHIATMFVERMGNRIRDAKWAVVADVTYEDAIRFSDYVEASAPRLIVFNELATACAWLGVDEYDVRPILDELRRSCSA
jgi:hypothetical protein